MSLNEIRRRPTLPGRFQPSTISVLRLNFCVRDGNRWIPQAIVTGNQTEFGCLCCRLSGIVGSAIDRPPDFLPALSLQVLRTPGLGALALRTLKTAQGRFAPARPRRSLLFRNSSQISSSGLQVGLWVGSRALLPASLFALPSVSHALLFPSAYSLLPSSQIKPSTD